jgi:hypothetical protein
VHHRALPRAGDVVDRYRVLAEVACGGMAAVFVVRRDVDRFDKLCAMKILLPHLREEPRFFDMFADEARIAAHVQHPNVVQVFDVGEHDGAPYIAMEYLRGETLHRVLSRRPALDRRLLYAVLGSVAEGLHAAHESKHPDGSALEIVHRDVSPQNVIVGFDGSIKIVDFGIAAARGRITKTREGELKGKVAYLAPEQLHRRQSIDRRTDLFAFGVMAFEALAGRPLFRADTESETMWNVVHRAAPDLVEIDASIPTEIADIIAGCLEKEPRLRPADAGEVASAFRRVADGSDRARRAELAAFMAHAFARERAADEARIAAFVADSHRTSEPAERTATTVARPARSRRGAWIAALLLAIAGGVGAAIAWSDPSSDQARADSNAARATDRSAGESGRAGSVRPGPEPPATDRIALPVDRSVRLVLVDGVVHEERPLVVELGSDRRAEIRLVGRDRELRTTVTAADDGRRLEVPRARRTGRAGRREEARSSGTGLLDVPL